MSLEGIARSVRLGGREILREVSLTLEPGELVMLLGLNGAGKSTLLRCLAGLEQRGSGQVRCEGRPLSNYPAAERARLVGMLFQHTPESHMTVEEYVLLGAAPFLRWGAVPGAKHRQRAEAALARMELLHLRQVPMNAVSGGERQRAALAQCLVTDARYLLLDEPTASLDVRRQHEFFHLLRGLTAEEKGALVSVHDPNLALSYAGRVLVLSEGRLLGVARAPGWEKELENCLRQEYSPALRYVQGGHFRWEGERSGAECLPHKSL